MMKKIVYKTILTACIIKYLKTLLIQSFVWSLWLVDYQRRRSSTKNVIYSKRSSSKQPSTKRWCQKLLYVRPRQLQRWRTSFVVSTATICGETATVFIDANNIRDDGSFWIRSWRCEICDTTFSLHICEWKSEEKCKILFTWLENLGSCRNSIGLEKV